MSQRVVNSSQEAQNGKNYEYRTTVTIGDTNLLQYMYFVHFFTLQGITRDLRVKEVVSGGLESIKNGLVLITRSARCEYKKDFYLYDRVLVRMRSGTRGTPARSSSSNTTMRRGWSCMPKEPTRS
ncbi:MAG: hypothetical protein H6Q05_3550 [Acidobacteria bacterium]|jgi:acyl-CoA thioesterase FadM|nr:hypothetical protein [Acidobacteriota bacterium]